MQLQKINILFQDAHFISDHQSIDNFEKSEDLEDKLENQSRIDNYEIGIRTRQNM